jgi:hypothetical protein
VAFLNHLADVENVATTARNQGAFGPPLQGFLDSSTYNPGRRSQTRFAGLLYGGLSALKGEMTSRLREAAGWNYHC